MMINSNAPQPVIFFDRPILQTSREEGDICKFFCPSGLNKIVSAFLADRRFSPPTIILQSGNPRALAEIVSLGPPTNIVLTPPGMSDAMAGLVSTLIDQGDDGNERLILIPAGVIVEDCSSFVDTVYRAYDNARKTGKQVLLCRKASQGSDIAFETGHRDRWSKLLTVTTAGSPADNEHFDIAMEMGKLFEPCGISVVSARALVAASRFVMPAMYSACTSAFAIAERKNGVLIPNAGFLSLVKGQTVSQLLATMPSKLLVDPSGGLIRVEAAPVAEEPASEKLNSPAHGHDDHQCEDWGSVELLLDKDGPQIHCLTIRSEKKAERQPHESKIINWSIISGQALIRYGTRLKTAVAGEVFRIPPGDKFSATNIGKADLVINETSIPAPVNADRRETG